MSDVARVLLVGAGQVAEDSHLPGLAALGDRVTLAGVCDPDPARARALAGDAPCFTDVDRALDAVGPDLVLIAAPPAVHADLAVRCLHAGSWVVCEKPPARSLAELDRIAAAEVRTGLPCAFVFQQRFGATAQLLHDPRARAVLGEVRAAAALTQWFRGPGYYEVPWRGRWSDEGGGALSSLGIHALDLALWLSGPWTEVAALAGSVARDIEVDNLSGAVVRLDGGGLLTVVTSALSPRQESRIRLDYDDATVELVHLYRYANADWRLTVRDGVAADRREELERFWRERGPDPATQYAGLFAAVLDARDRGEAPPCSGTDGRAAFELVTACYASALTGRAVRRGDIGPGSPFHTALDGGLAPWSRDAAVAQGRRP